MIFRVGFEEELEPTVSLRSLPHDPNAEKRRTPAQGLLSVGNQFSLSSASLGMPLDDVICFHFLICKISELGNTLPRSIVMLRLYAQYLVPDPKQNKNNQNQTNQTNKNKQTNQSIKQTLCFSRC